MPSTSPLFHRSWIASGNGNPRCIPAPQMCWIRPESDTFIFVGLYFCLLVLQSIMIWRSTGRIKRFIRSVFKATTTEHQPTSFPFEGVVVHPESTVPSESLDTAIFQDGQNELHGITPSERSQQQAIAYSTNHVWHYNSPASAFISEPRRYVRAMGFSGHRRRMG